MALVSAGDFGTAAKPRTLELVHNGHSLSVSDMTSVAAAH